MFTDNKDKQFTIKQPQILSLPQRRFYLPRFYVPARLCTALSSRTQQQWWWGQRLAQHGVLTSHVRDPVFTAQHHGEKRKVRMGKPGVQESSYTFPLFDFFLISFSSLPDTSTRMSSDLLLENEKAREPCEARTDGPPWALTPVRESTWSQQ